MATIKPSYTEDRLNINRLGLWLFILSESFLFMALLVSRYYISTFERPAELNQPLGFAISIVLLLSSLTAYRCEMAAACGNEKMFRRNILMTLVLGGLFLVGVAVEWIEGFRFFPPSRGFGILFFTLTGFHAFHVITGLAALVVVLVKSQFQKGLYGTGNYWAVEGAVKYWHFVDVAWVFIYPTLYLVS